MKVTATGWIVLGSALAAALIAAAARADEFLAMPGLWQTTYEVEGAAGKTNVVWHCVDEAADPWVAWVFLRQSA